MVFSRREKLYKFVQFCLAGQFVLSLCASTKENIFVNKHEN